MSGGGGALQSPAGGIFAFANLVVKGLFGVFSRLNAVQADKGFFLNLS
jgi:hypothetical protein